MRSLQEDFMRAIAIAIFAAAFAAISASSPASAEGTPSPEGARVYFIGLKDGDKEKSPVLIRFGLRGMGVAPAGVEAENTGHHHLLIDRPPLGEGAEGAAELTQNMPADDNHMHFGKGQTEVVLELSPGEHTLQLVLGDKDHIPHNPPVMSKRITITVE
jgi:hypothetical protein